jgi:hypothetical protein
MPLSEREMLAERVRHEREKENISKTFETDFYSKLADEGISEAAVSAFLAVFTTIMILSITPDVTLSKVAAIIGIVIAAIMCTAFGIWIMYHSRNEVSKMAEKRIKDEIAEDQLHINTLTNSSH